MKEDERTSVRLIEALAQVWSKIRERHPEVPGVVLLAAPAHRDQLHVLGHFAALRWRRRQEQGHHLHEVVVIAEHLNRPVEEIVETLIHEAAHALNFERGIKDCTQSQYHNRRFRDAALELGLLVEQVRHYGYALTSLPAATALIYQEEMSQLREVLVHRYRPEFVLGGAKPAEDDGDDGQEDDNQKTRTRSRKATCACPFIIRVSKTTIEATTIRCEKCGEAFRLS